MKKFYLLLILAMTVSAVSAARPSYLSKDRKAIEAVLKTRLPRTVRLNYMVRLAELDDPSIGKDFNAYMETVEKIGRENKLSAKTILDVQISSAFRRRSFMANGYEFAKAKNHPYELRFMIQKQLAATVSRSYPTPADRYTAALELMNRHLKDYSRWKQAALQRQHIGYIIRNGRAGKVASMKEDLQALKARIIGGDGISKASFAGVADMIDKACASAPAKKAAVKAPRKAGKKPVRKVSEWHTMRNTVYAALKKDPSLARDFKRFAKFCDDTALANDISTRVLADAKCAIPFSRRQMIREAYQCCVELEHPYELRYIIMPARYSKQLNKYLPDNKSRYDRVLYLLKKHTERYTAWNEPEIIISAVDYLKKTAGSEEVFVEDCKQLKLIFTPYAALKPKAWTPVMEKLDEYTR